MKQSDTDEEQAFYAILYKLKRVKGLDFSQYRSACLKRRIDTRLYIHHLKNYKEYIQFLRKNPAEYDELLNAATINVSEFFRDKSSWKFVQQTLLPTLIQKKIDKNQRTIRVWSAGCSSGEEVYTLAIIFNELLGKQIDQFNIKIYGTDIDKISLKKAQEGRYSSENMQNIGADELNRYFDQDGKYYTIKNNLRLFTAFENRDLVLAEPLKCIDLIACRNVLIYFSKALQEKIMAKFNRALNPNGILMLGKTETYGTHMEEYFQPYYPAERIYQKR